MLKLNKETLPLIPVRGLVVFPQMVLHFDVARPKSITALENAMASNQLVFLSTQKDVTIEVPDKDDIYEIGVVAKIKQLLKLPGDSVRVLVEGLYRAKIKNIVFDEPYFLADVVEKKTKTASLSSEEFDAMERRIRELLEDYLDLSPKIAPETIMSIIDSGEPVSLADSLSANLLIKTSDKQIILETLDVKDRLIELIKILEREIKVLEIEDTILNRVHSQMDKNNREYFLREQVKAIREELGESEDSHLECEEYRRKVALLNLGEQALEKVEKELKHLEKMPSSSSEATVIRSWLDLLVSLPWNKKTEESFDISRAREILSREHFGLEKVKERIIEYLAVRSISKEMKGSILCLVGPPGVGKTSIVRSIAEAVGRKYVRMSLGGIRDEAEIRGHRRTYIGSMPGRIISAINTAGSKNALILLDEIDKMKSDAHGDPASAMLEVLDSEQNFAFRDHYLELPFDLSEIMFVTTANSYEDIPAPLLDRMELIELSGYTEDEKREIAQNYLIKKQLKKHGLKPSNLKISPDAIDSVISNYTREAGVRNLEREIATICRKGATVIVEGEKKSVSVTALNLSKFLGAKKFEYEHNQSIPQTGVVTGLAWTSVGGDTLSVEVNIMDGSGKLELTGNLGDVMKESCKTAFSYVRSRADKFSIESDFYKKYDIHIHVPEGATPKDGPSAGVTIATALVSALSKRAVRPDTAMTGEITLRGRVLKIGGLKEKVLAAHRIGIKTVFIPLENKQDILELPLKIQSSINFVCVSSCDEIINSILLPVAKDSIKKISDKKSEVTVHEYS